MFRDTRLPDRFWSKIELDTVTGCWIWRAYVKPDGYGVFRYGDSVKYAHRVSYTTLVCSIGSGLEIDHLCRVRNCVNPEHLETVTHTENVCRSERFTPSHCPRGHEYTDANTYMVRASNKRQCRECGRVRDADRRARRRVWHA